MYDWIYFSDPSICGSKSIYEGLTGNITSPGYPGNYSAGINCVWHIKVPVKYAVSITFDSFNLEHDKFCFFDSVEFFDGASVNSKSIRRVCGTTIPQNIRSSLGIITIRMKTDDTIESSGFVLRWNLTEPNYPRKQNLFFHVISSKNFFNAGIIILILARKTSHNQVLTKSLCRAEIFLKILI